jgi:hypothetical protein
MAPFLGSCDGRGTSRRRPPVTGSRSLEVVALTEVIDVADLEDEDDIEAAGAARMRVYGTELDAGKVNGSLWQGAGEVLRSAIGATVLDRDIILCMSKKRNAT